MSDVFFEDLNMKPPDVHLNVGSGSHATQTARIMIEFEKVCNDHEFAMVVVVGDVNSTIACISRKKIRNLSHACRSRIAFI